ncbi:tRNA-uridine isomerase 3 [Hyphodiscus hymeniophilus]|uniref:tRNA-uridine isomerase 3 n=1 Tax=Hyphodiscus hymeniophilus TaxID=353542 RepID=A0A9P6VQD0_9HELO|nr:tRNA-uridine isomerase 3 [Hyphodiscus hymeniophilus]
MAEKTDYSVWSQAKLIERVTELERELKEKNRSLLLPKKSYKRPHVEKPFDPLKYNTRLIALRLAYLGKNYNGFEHHSGNPTPLPTIEEVLWKALNKVKLIFPDNSHTLPPGEINWEGTEYSKCGRTDKGVNAFGQVIGLRLRSNRPLRKKVDTEEQEINGPPDGEGQIEETFEDGFNTSLRPGEMETSSSLSSQSARPAEGPESDASNLDGPESEAESRFDPIADEIPYATLLNRVLPPDIRILAWCPFPTDNFSARFSCRERRYRYIFTQPAFSPIPHKLEHGADANTTKDGWLDIEAMREAAKMYEGLHDFRNFCKVDGGKQITNYERRIFYSNIEEVDDQSPALKYVSGTDFLPVGSEDQTPKVYTFTLHGSAFLWHQVRHMVAILFLVGQGLEKPSIVTELLDIEKTPRRPGYEMAQDTPLVLWDCIFPHEDDLGRKDVMPWIYAGDGPGNADTKFGAGGLMDSLWSTWRERKIDEMLAGTLLSLVVSQGDKPADFILGEGKARKSQKVFDGGDTPRSQGVYVPVMKKPLLESPDAINEKYAVRKGFESAADMRIQGFRRENKPPRETVFLGK